MKVPLLDLKAQYAGIREDVRARMDSLCDSQMFILGATVEAFEKRVAAYCGTGHAVGVSSGTDALLAALMALQIGRGDAVITTPYSFFATAGCIARLDATPVFVDIDPVTFNISPEAVRQLLKHRGGRLAGLKPRVLMPVHLFGQSADMSALLEIANDFNLAVVEDAAQAIGVEYRLGGSVRKAGSMGRMGCFSFFPSKNLGGFGDGGMVTTDDPVLADVLRRLRNHGMHPKYHHGMIGGNFRLDALQAAVLDVKLDHLEAWHEARRHNAARYNSAFEGTAVQPPQAVHSGQGLRNHHIYNQYVVRVPGRDAVRKALEQAGIGHEVYYPVPLHLQECFRPLGYKPGDMPESEKAAAETLALPIYPELTAEMQNYVAQTLTAAVSAAG